MTDIKLRAVLFDLDGTLLDTAPDFSTALNLLREERGMRPLPEAEIRANVTNGSAGLIQSSFALDPAHPEFEALRQGLLRHYMAHICDRTRPFPGVDTLLTQLADLGLHWGIVTNKPARFTHALLAGLGMVPAPGAVVCPDHVTHNKPHPEPVLLACRLLGVAPEHTVYIGDHRRDIESGLQAGAVTAVAAYGYIDSGENPRDWGAQHIIEDSRRLPEFIQELIG